MITNLYWLLVGLILGGATGAAVHYVLMEKRRRFVEAVQIAAQQQMSQVQAYAKQVASQQLACESDRKSLLAIKQELESRVITYQELQGENRILKRDLRNLDITIRKTRLDDLARQQEHERISRQINDLCTTYLKENVKWISSSLNQNNFVSCKQRLTNVVNRCRSVGFAISPLEEAAYVDELKKEYERVVRAALEREEQARIKAIIREEQAREREVLQEMKRIERESDAIKSAIEKALAKSHNEHTEEVRRLEEKLAEAEERAKRTISQAQLTKAGHVYVISNIGSFGENVFKIGMTRRLEPFDRVNELGDASVPFPFDVHMMISSNDAPTLENALHRTFHRMRLNKANPRKEFFRTTIQEIVAVVEANHGSVDYLVDAEALQFRQSQEMSVDDQEFIEHLYDEVEDDGQAA